MTTRKEIIFNKYNELRNLLQQNFNDDFINKISSVFPDIENLDITDLLFYVGMLFDKSNIHDALKNYLWFNGIQLNDDDINKLCNILKPFIVFIKELK